MKLREWYGKEVARKKMCVECTEITHLNQKRCLGCTCSTFFFLTNLIDPKKIDRILYDAEAELKKKLKTVDRNGRSVYDKDGNSIPIKDRTKVQPGEQHE